MLDCLARRILLSSPINNSMGPEVCCTRFGLIFKLLHILLKVSGGTDVLSPMCWIPIAAILCVCPVVSLTGTKKTGKSPLESPLIVVMVPCHVLICLNFSLLAVDVKTKLRPAPTSNKLRMTANCEPGSATVT